MSGTVSGRKAGPGQMSATQVRLESRTYKPDVRDGVRPSSRTSAKIHGRPNISIARIDPRSATSLRMKRSIIFVSSQGPKNDDPTCVANHRSTSRSGSGCTP